MVEAAVVEGVDPKSIIVAERLRGVDPAWVEVLAASIRERGQDTPIRVRRQADGLHLVFGAHRLQACILSDVTVRAEIVECSDLEARLMEIDENLFRRELGALDRAVSLAERQEVYLQLHPETARGVAGGLARQGSASDILSFAEETAERTGFSRRTIERAVALARGIPRELRERLRGSEIANNAAALDYLSKLPAEMQQRAVALVVGGGAKTLRDAVEVLEGRSAPPPDADDKQFFLLEKMWDRASPAAKARFLALLRASGEINETGLAA